MIKIINKKILLVFAFSILEVTNFYFPIRAVAGVQPQWMQSGCDMSEGEQNMCNFYRMEGVLGIADLAEQIANTVCYRNTDNGSAESGINTSDGSTTVESAAPVDNDAEMDSSDRARQIADLIENGVINSEDAADENFIRSLLKWLIVYRSNLIPDPANHSTTVGSDAPVDNASSVSGF